MRKQNEVFEIMGVLEKLNPNPKSELFYTNDYTLLVAIILSAQSTDKGVNKATPALFEVADNPQKMVDLGLENLKSYIKTIGLYNNKANNIIKMSRTLLDEYGGRVPSERTLLEKLPGVGRKTANVLLNVWYNKPYIAVDTHVMRLAKRLGFSNGKTPLDIEKDLEKIIPDQFKVNTNHLLVLFGRYLCKAKKPHCFKCPIAHLCKSADKNL